MRPLPWRTASHSSNRRATSPTRAAFGADRRRRGEGHQGSASGHAVIPAAVDEARALRPAYQRAVVASHGRTLVGRVVAADRVPDALAALTRIAEGTPSREAGLPADPIQTVMDVRAYYEEAAVALSDHVPAARSAETWFYHHTEAGRVVLAARHAIKASGAPFPVWFYMAPATQ